MKNTSPLAKQFLERGRAESCPVIDMHGHYGPFSAIYFPAPYADGMLRSMDRCGIVSIVISSHAALIDPVRGNQEVAQLARDHPGRFYGYRVINPNHPDQAGEDLERFETDRGFVGVKFHPDMHSYQLTGDRYVSALEYAARRRLLLLTHTWGGSQFCAPKLVAELAEKYPGATFLLGHAPHHAEQHSAVSAFSLPHLAQPTVDLLSRFFADTAGVEQDQVGFLGRAHRNHAAVTEQTLDLLRVVLVHLAAEGLYVKVPYFHARSAVLDSN